MKFTKESLELETGITKEWVITNGIGGFASSTIIGANTRKYHGLLIAPLNPPANRYVILSKLDESIEVRGKQYDLYTNICESYISHGYQYQEEFEKDYYPTFKYKVQGIEIEKSICMEYNENTVGVYYKIKNGRYKSKLTLAPIMNFRDFHTMNTGHHFDVKQQVNGTKIKVVIDDKSQTPIYMNLSEGTYIPHENDNFEHMFYVEEEKRGFYPEENHSVPGVYEISVKAKQEKNISFVCSLEENIEEIDVQDLINKESLKEIKAKLAEVNIQNTAKELEVGEMTLKDIIEELSKPGRDPRDEMPKPVLRADVLKFEDLREGQILTGTVRNVTDFGAFVDIGVKHDGLVHISEMSNSYVKNPSDVVSVGDIVRVKVIGIDQDRQKVKLSMKI